MVGGDAISVHVGPSDVPNGAAVGVRVGRQYWKKKLVTPVSIDFEMVHVHVDGFLLFHEIISSLI